MCINGKLNTKVTFEFVHSSWVVQFRMASEAQIWTELKSMFEADEVILPEVIHLVIARLGLDHGLLSSLCCDM